MGLNGYFQAFLGILWKSLMDEGNGLERADAGKIDLLRRRKGLSYANLCTKAAIDRKTLDRALTGSVRISTISKIANALGVAPDMLLVNDKLAHTEKKQENYIDLNVGRFRVRITTAKHFAKDHIRIESEKLAQAIYIFCDMLDGWDIDELDPEMGSTIFTMRLSESDARRLTDLFFYSLLERFEVTSVNLAVEPTTFPPSVVVVESDLEIEMKEIRHRVNPFGFLVDDILTENERIHRALSQLTAGERQFLTLWVRGKRPEAIAEFFGVDITAVERHKRDIMAKLGGTDVGDLIDYVRTITMFDVSISSPLKI